MYLDEHPDWRWIQPWLYHEVYNRDGSAIDPRDRFEVNAPEDPRLLQLLLAVEITCARCDRVIRPIREREGWHGKVFVAVSCQMNDHGEKRYGCARSKAARYAVKRLKAALLNNPPPPAPPRQRNLFT